MTKKRILLLIPNLDFGGAQRSFSKLSLEYARENDVFIGVFNTFEGIAYPYGGTLLDLNIPGSESVNGKVLNFIKRVKQVKQIKRQYKIDISISFLEGADYVNLLSKQQEKTIISIRGSKMYDGEIKGWVGYLRKKLFMPTLYKRADQIITVSEGLKNEMVEDFNLSPEKVKTIYNFYNLNSITAQAAEPLNPQQARIFNRTVIINSGRLHIQKAQDALLRIFARVHKKQNCCLVILGDGSLRDELLILCSALKLKAYASWLSQEMHDQYDVYFLGYQENPFKFISNANLFAFTSAWEGFPNAVAEAMACHLPVVSADCPTGPREILAPGTSLHYQIKSEEMCEYGVLLPVCPSGRENPMVQIWADTLDKLLSDEQLLKHYKQKAAERVNAFTEEVITQKWRDLITTE